MIRQQWQCLLQNDYALIFGWSVHTIIQFVLQYLTQDTRSCRTFTMKPCSYKALINLHSSVVAPPFKPLHHVWPNFSIFGFNSCDQRASTFSSTGVWGRLTQFVWIWWWYWYWYDEEWYIVVLLSYVMTIQDFDDILECTAPGDISIDKVRLVSKSNFLIHFNSFRLLYW